ncbi:endo-1,3-alpha-glucanase family glycosylhydrolase [Embleya sp. NPDC127516]|uniref:endo-1,3-alpha-glucanase family glycosylhydrolase n=1 Tax=Embleya sp. NPDC127516 TaxID=3363990 RepID=UPI0037F6AE6B
MRFRSLKFVLPAFLLVGAGVTFGVASGDSDNSKATVPTNENAYVSQVAPAKAHATQTWLSVCPATCEGAPRSERRAFVKFTVAGVPAGARDVRLSLDLYSARTTDTSVRVHKVTGSWSAKSLTWNKQPAFGDVVGSRDGFTASQVGSIDVSSAFAGNGAYSFALTAGKGAQGVFQSSRASAAQAPRLSVSWTDPATPTTGSLPFEMPSTSALRASDKKVYAHYFTPYPASLDNQEPTQDYYSRNYLNPAGESGKHAAYGGLLRDRPVPRGPLTGDWQLQDMQREIRDATAAGVDGFTVDVLSTTGAHWTRIKNLIKAAETVDPGFAIVLMPDMTSLKDATPASLAASMADLASSRSVRRLADGRVVISPFKAEQQTPQWWGEFATAMTKTHKLGTALVPVFLNFSANADKYASVSYGFSSWGNRSPNRQGNIQSDIAKAHSLGKIWMQPVAVQDERPNQGIYDEANNTENLRTSWDNTISGGADWVQLTTWNDYSEGTQFQPSANSGHTWVDISDYYLVRFKTGAWPRITRDTAYLTHRVQFAAAKPTGGTQTKLMTPRSGTNAPRDSVEVLTFLVAPATVNATIGGAGQSYQAAAGVQAKLFPLAYGTNSASIVRNSATVATVSSPNVVRKDFAAQDLGYRGASSGRPGAG